MLSQAKPSHKREEYVLSKVKYSIGEECDIVSRSQKTAAKIETDSWPEYGLGTTAYRTSNPYNKLRWMPG